MAGIQPIRISVKRPQPDQRHLIRNKSYGHNNSNLELQPQQLTLPRSLWVFSKRLSSCCGDWGHNKV